MFQPLGAEKPVQTFQEFIREDAEINILKWWADRRREHLVEGCPLERGFAGCVICEVPKF